MTKKFFLFASVLGLFLGCTSIPDDLRDEASGKRKYSYCILVEQQICLSGSFTSCAYGGLLSNDCPYGTQRSSSSAWNNILSSSSRISSSSVWFTPAISSNSYPSSSSVASSSSSYPSSSSVASSSSSSPSSSSSSSIYIDASGYCLYSSACYNWTQSTCNSYGGSFYTNESSCQSAAGYGYCLSGTTCVNTTQTICNNAGLQFYTTLSTCESVANNRNGNWCVYGSSICYDVSRLSSLGYTCSNLSGTIQSVCPSGYTMVR
ncbi:MAG: hypothetical protein FWB90_08845 [Fibromonadales bacterium]|nr:hypothetical protein [Fibromonadales bacterium]